MNAKGLFEVVMVAAGVAALLIAGLYPAGLDAVESPASPVENNRPTLVTAGVEMTLTMADGAKPVAGQTPVLALEAVNTSEQPVETSVMLLMTQTAPSSKESRMVPRPTVIWSDTRALRLEPKAKTSLRIETGVTLPAGKETVVLMREPVAGVVSQNSRQDNAAQMIRSSIRALDLTVSARPTPLPALAAQAAR